MQASNTLAKLCNRTAFVSNFDMIWIIPRILISIQSLQSLGRRYVSWKRILYLPYPVTMNNHWKKHRARSAIPDTIFSSMQTSFQ